MLVVVLVVCNCVLWTSLLLEAGVEVPFSRTASDDGHYRGFSCLCVRVHVCVHVCVRVCVGAGVTPWGSTIDTVSLPRTHAGILFPSQTVSGINKRTLQARFLPVLGRSICRQLPW